MTKSKSRLRMIVSGTPLVLAICSLSKAAVAAGVAFQTGDVFAAVGRGVVKHFRPDGTLVDTLSYSSSGTYDTGMAFDSSHVLYVTGFDSNNVYRFDPNGNLLGAFGGGYNSDPESIVFDRSGNAYVGQPDGSRQIREFSSAGAFLTTFSPAHEDRGTDWLGLAADQCTMHYTSEGDSVLAFNVCTNSQSPVFATGLEGPCYAHRIRPNGEELVACSSLVYRLNGLGGVIGSYALGGALFALNLDPDNKTFWTADYGTGNVYHVDIATGAVVRSFNAGAAPFLGGLAVAGEITASTLNTAPPATTSYYVTTDDSSVLFKMGSDLALSQVISGGAVQDSVVALLFRAPTLDKSTGEYGTSGLGGSTAVSDIATLVEDFASGYYNAVGTLHIRIVVATSNGTTSRGGSQVTYEHGVAWAKMVNSVADWVIAQGYASQIDIAGGSDMEAGTAKWPDGSPQWAHPAETSAWVNGYASVSPTRFLYDVGDAGGCPNTGGQTATPGQCNAPWTQDDIWYVSWGATPSEPLPEIYTIPKLPKFPLGKQAPQWAQLSLYSLFQYNSPIIFSGALTESGACAQKGCSPSENTAAEGWGQLYAVLNGDSRTQETLPWSTDISWSPR